MRATYAAALLVALGGCGPSIRGLVAGHHDREVVCAAVDGAERAALSAFLDDEASVQVSVAVVDDAAVREANARGASPVSVALLRVDAQSDVLPVDDLTLSAAMGSVDGSAAAIPARWDALAWWTGEPLPPPRLTQTYVTGGNLLRLGAAALTAGLSLLFSDFRPDVIAVDAPVAAYRASAPRAARIVALTTDAGCRALSPGAGAGVRCTWFFLYAARDASPLALALTTRFVALRVGGTRLDPDRCVLPRTATVVLGSPDRWTAPFASGPRRLRALATPAPLAAAAAWERIAEAFSPRR